MIAVGLLIVFLAVYGFWEFRRHQKNIDRVPIRVLINGTRGKSSVTRLITGGLQAGGLRTLGKTTGTKPRYIYPDGTEIPIERVGRANIIEQLKVFRKAISMDVDALVVECMAVLPPNQIIMEKQMVRSTVGVITNARADHLDEMGPTVEDVARSLSQTTPTNSVLFTAEEKFFPVMCNIADERNSKAVRTKSSDVTDAMMQGFSYLEHKDNVSLALAVCEHLSVPRGQALLGMQRAIADPGVLRIFKVHYYEKELEFVNGFAANDPDSYVVIWEMLKSFFTEDKKVIVIVNSRQDRVQRTEALAELITFKIRADHFILAGESTAVLYNRALALDIPKSKIADKGGDSAEEIFQYVASLTPQKSIIIGIGNIVGFGEEIVMNFTNRGKEIAY